jgi:membrane protein implicated in regulation of membrane protease activity
MPSENGIPLYFFIGLTFLQIILLRKSMKKVFLGNVASHTEEIDEDFIGKSGTTSTHFTDLPDSGGRHHGKVHFRGTDWVATSKTPLSKGQRVLIEGRSGSLINVRSV